MAHGVNLMTERAQFRSALQCIVRGWLLATGAIIVALIPIGVWVWRQSRELVREHEALEASYEPFRRLSGENRVLAAQGAQLVSREQAVLELSRERSALDLLAVVNEAIEESHGAAFVDHITIACEPAASGRPGAGGGGRMTISASSTLSYEAPRLAKSLSRAPFTSVKIVSSETMVDGGVNRKHHVIECEF